MSTPAPKQYFLHNGTDTTGPFTVDELFVFQSSGALGPATRIHDGKNWVPAADFIRTLKPSGDPEQTLRAAQLLEAEPEPAMTGAHWESLLFILSFPVLIPSLILSFVMAKRWGHLDIYLILIDGLLLTGLAFLGGYLVGGIVLVSWISSVFLYWLRRNRQREGIFLGYSNVIALLLIFGGSLTLYGIFAVLPLAEFNRWQRIRQKPVTATVKAALNHALQPGRTYVFSDGALDFEHAVYHQQQNGQWRFITKQKAGGFRFDRAHVRGVWANYQEVSGREVELVDVPAAGFGGPRERLEVLEGQSKRMLDTPGLNFSLVDGTEGRLWIASSRPVSTERLTVRGVARIIYNDNATGREYTKAKRGNVPVMAVAVFEGEKGAPVPAPEVQETWVPVKDTGGAFWIRFPAGVTPAGNEPVRGIYTMTVSDADGLRTMNSELFSGAESRVLYQQAPSGYIAEEKIFESIGANVTWKKFPWLAGGLGLLGLAIWRARNE